MSVDAVQIDSAKELEHEFTQMLVCFRDKETELNWESREKALGRLRGLLRGNAPEVYLESLVQGLRQMTDGIVKAVESLRTQLAIKALSLVADIAQYIGKHLDSYMLDQLLLCLMRCAGVTKKMVSSASFQTTHTFLKHALFYPKFVPMLTLAMAEKNVQVRLFTVHYARTLLHTYAPRDAVRAVMDRSHATDGIEAILLKGLNDPSPGVKEVSREAFWIFCEHWQLRGESVLKQLPAVVQKQLEKSKHPLKKPDPPSRSTEKKGSPTRKTRVPLTKKKSVMGLNKPKSLWRLLISDDLNTRAEGFTGLANLLDRPYTPHPEPVSLENGDRPVEPEALKALLLQSLQAPAMANLMATETVVTGVCLKLLTLEEYLPGLILAQNHTALALAQPFLVQAHPELIPTLLHQVVLYSRLPSLPQAYPDHRPKLTHAFLIWLNALVDHPWFKSDRHLSHALTLLLPLVSIAHTLWQPDLYRLLQQLRLLQPTLLDTAVSQDPSLCRALGISPAVVVVVDEPPETCRPVRVPVSIASSPQSSPALGPTRQSTPTLSVSEPDPHHYPSPDHVDFFRPAKVHAPCAVFQANRRTPPQTGLSVRKDKAVLLYALIDQLKAKEQIHPTFHKLTRLLRDTPIRRRWDQGGSEETGSDTWAGALADGGNFVELVQTLLPYLQSPIEPWTLPALECTCQMAIAQSGLLKFFERKSNRYGSTLESQLIERLLELRSHTQPSISMAAEDALEAVLNALSTPTAFEVVMAFIIYRSILQPYQDPMLLQSKYHPLGSAFIYAAKLVKELNDLFYIEEWLNKGAVNSFFKGINSTLIYVRKACVEAIVAFHGVMKDDIYLCLTDLRDDQSNLVRHYAAKSLKKKASARNMRETHPFL
ncbi:clasp N terminal-domain-containing protein [Sporodiniella umbellata]|nr:clasp N terminal-domain-containing protein [Sporodiniella umbellata]